MKRLIVLDPHHKQSTKLFVKAVSDREQYAGALYVGRYFSVVITFMKRLTVLDPHHKQNINIKRFVKAVSDRQ